MINRRIVLASRTQAFPTPAHFRIEDKDLRSIGDGEVLLRILYLLLDPYMRGRMSAARSYAKPAEVNEVMEGATVAEVLQSRNPLYAPGEIVLSHSGWQSYAISNGKGLRKLDPAAAPITTALGVLGMPGFTAYVAFAISASPNRARCSSLPRRAGRSGPASARSRTSRQPAWLVSPAAKKNVPISETNSASMPRSTTARLILRNN
jgi:NADPH-dependent curcumin reductase